ncbi:hypothetical protein [Plesiomonas shigelloides]|uniref:hypothetical protein n=1 Tax=Plesiomonas shigelloides TaxID=703 RepID=UPI00126164FC|nr:hypothetical protein [Plesiomonas shigelloides]KAB7674650.1 hypothetical protein GBN23_13025 [Plesiomonas shigelloides]MCQ8857244.1 hypothetical protein [Plesiomonas shigelloides]
MKTCRGIPLWWAGMCCSLWRLPVSSQQWVSLMALLGVLDAFLARNWSRLGVHSGALALALTWLGMVIFH